MRSRLHSWLQAPAADLARLNRALIAVAEGRTFSWLRSRLGSWLRSWLGSWLGSWRGSWLRSWLGSWQGSWLGVREGKPAEKQRLYSWLGGRLGSKEANEK